MTEAITRARSKAYKKAVEYRDMNPGKPITSAMLGNWFTNSLREIQNEKR